MGGADDAAVSLLDQNTCIIATTDFLHADGRRPFHFGRIAATNTLSDFYAIGGKPILALAIVGMPLDKIPVEMVRAILKGGASVRAAAGIPVAGGHSIDGPEPVYGAAVLGICRPEHVRRNADVRAGDALILTQATGRRGLFRRDREERTAARGLHRDDRRSTTLLNRVGSELALDVHVHAMTDATGFGVLGHALEMARGAGLTVVIQTDELPLLTEAQNLARRGFVTGASHRNWTSYGADVRLPPDTRAWQRHLTSPRTSGGLLVACAPERTDEIAGAIRAAGLSATRIIGHA